MDEVRLGIAGTGSIADTQTRALARVPGVGLAAVLSRSRTNAEAFAQWKGIPEHFDDLEEFLKVDMDAVSVCFPNSRHYEVATAAAKAGLHVIVEKPLAMSLAQADGMIAACQKAGKVLCYAEELCFVPKYARVKELVEEGALGEVYMVRQTEKHAGPYSEWFFKRETAGGGALMDMGCHGIEAIRWIKGKAEVVEVSAQLDTFVQGEKTDLEDHAVVTMRFEDGSLGISESSWALQGGMESILEVYGTKGVVKADLCRGSGISIYSDVGYGMIPDLAKGWTVPDYNHDIEQGYVGEMEHFIDCIRNGKPPSEGAGDGKKVLEIMLAAYQSASTGRSVPLPFQPGDAEAPVDLWKKPTG